MKTKKKAGFKNRNVHIVQKKVQDLEVLTIVSDSQKLKQLTGEKQPQHHRNNILLIIIVILVFIAVLFVLNLTATQREKIALGQSEQQNDYLPYEDVVEEKETTQEKKQLTQQQIIPDVTKEIVQKATVISEKQLLETAEEIQQQKPKEQSKSTEQYFVLESQLSSDYNMYFLGGCKDSDGGKNFNEDGTTVSKTGSAEQDSCSTAKQYPNRLYEFYCDSNQMARKMIFECMHGCIKGACVVKK